MLRLALLVLLLFGATSVAQAGWFESNPDSKDLKQALAQPGLSVTGYRLSGAELNAFYAARAYRPAWDTGSPGHRESLNAFMDSLAGFIAYHGLQSRDYPLDLVKKLIASSATEAEALRLELLVTDLLLRLAHDMHGDGVDLADLYPGWNFTRAPLDVSAALAKAVEANGINAFIAGLAPRDPAYARLAQELQTYRAKAQQGHWPLVDRGPKLVPGDTSPRVAQVRARLAMEGYAELSDSPHYDEPLEEAVKSFQAHNGLAADGRIGPATVAAMNVSLQGRLDQIVATMERWRHMPEAMPSRYARVNIAAATVTVWEDGRPLYKAPVIVGRPDRKTPFIQSALRSVIFNPAWHVPAKIARKDILPKLRKDPHYLEKLGFVIIGSADNPHGEDVDWNKVRENSFNFQLRQAPGDMNSLGRLKFDFDNDFSVYMHGTPHQELFAKPERHLSSGCVRLHDPDEFAELLLVYNEGSWTLDRIREEVDKEKTRWLRINQPLPLYIVYDTVFPGEADGPLQFRRDVYDYDRLLIEAMHAKRG